MKKNRFFWASAAIAALTLTACADQDEFNQNDVQTAAVENAPGAIQFGTYLGENGTTRAWDATSTNTLYGKSYSGGIITTLGSATPQTRSLYDAEFGVFAYQTGAANWENDKYAAKFMYNQYIQSIMDGSTFKRWDYSPAKYWPNGIDKANADNDPSNTAVESGIQKLSFFAYAPYTANVDGTTYANIDAAIDHGGMNELEYPASTVYSAYPTGLSQSNVFKTVAYETAEDKGGVVGMTDWNATVDPWVNYVLNSTSTKEAVDLLWGVRGQYKYDETDNTDNTQTEKLGNTYNVDLTKQSVDEKVRFMFKHALAKIGGSTKKNDDANDDPRQSGLLVVVDIDANSTNPGAGIDKQSPTYFTAGFTNTQTLVTLKDVKIRDTYTYSNEAGTSITPATASNIKRNGWFNIATGEWQNAAIWKTTGEQGALAELYVDNNTTNTNTANLNPKIKEIGAYKGTGTGKQVNGNGTWTVAKVGDEYNYPWGVTTTPTKVYANEDNNGLVLIPAGDNPQTLYITVDYFVRTADQQLAAGYSEVEQIITNKVDLVGLEANKYYTLVIHLGLTSVKFEAIVADWSGSQDEQYDEDGIENKDDNDNYQAVWLPSNVVNTTTITADANTTHKAVTVAGHTTSYTIHVTGLSTSNTITVSKEGTSAGVASTTPILDTETAVTSATDEQITVTLTPNNTGNSVENTIVVTEKNGANTISTTKVKITQAPGVLTLTAKNSSDVNITTIESTETSYKVLLTNGGNNDVEVQNIVSPKSPDITTGGTVAINGSDSHQIDVTIPANPTVNDITWTVTVKQDGLEATSEVIQKGGELAVALNAALSAPKVWTNATAGPPAVPANLALGSADAISSFTPGYKVTVNGTDQSGYTFTSDSSWLSINSTTGAITATANTGAARTATVTITLGSKTVTFTVTQPAA